MKLMSSRPSSAMPSGYLKWLAKALLKPQPRPGIREGRIYSSQVITSKTRKGQICRALALTWVNALGHPVWFLPQLVPLGLAGTKQRAQAVETVRQILRAGGHECANPLVITAENLKGIRAGMVLSEVRHWSEPKQKIIQIERFMIHL